MKPLLCSFAFLAGISIAVDLGRMRQRPNVIEYMPKIAAVNPCAAAAFHKMIGIASRLPANGFANTFSTRVARSDDPQMPRTIPTAEAQSTARQNQGRDLSSSLPFSARLGFRRCTSSAKSTGTRLCTYVVAGAEISRPKPMTKVATTLGQWVGNARSSRAQ